MEPLIKLKDDLLNSLSFQLYAYHHGMHAEGLFKNEFPVTRNKYNNFICVEEEATTTISEWYYKQETSSHIRAVTWFTLSDAQEKKDTKFHFDKQNKLP